MEIKNRADPAALFSMMIEDKMKKIKLLLAINNIPANYFIIKQ